MKNYPILNGPGKGTYALIFTLNERAVEFLCLYGFRHISKVTHISSSGV